MNCEGSNGHFTATLQATIQGTLSDDTLCRGRVVKGRKEFSRLFVVAAQFDAHSALAARWQRALNGNTFADPVGHLQSNQACAGQNNGVVLALIKFA